MKKQRQKDMLDKVTVANKQNTQPNFFWIQKPLQYNSAVYVIELIIEFKEISEYLTGI